MRLATAVRCGPPTRCTRCRGGQFCGSEPRGFHPVGRTARSGLRPANPSALVAGRLARRPLSEPGVHRLCHLCCCVGEDVVAGVGPHERGECRAHLPAPAWPPGARHNGRVIARGRITRVLPEQAVRVVQRGGLDRLPARCSADLPRQMPISLWRIMGALQVPLS